MTGRPAMAPRGAQRAGWRWAAWAGLFTFLALLPAAAPAGAAQADPAAGPVVRAILFYSPQCPHCHTVMREHLPPLLRRHGEALRIVAVNVDTQEGQALYREVIEHFDLPRERLGVPALVAGDRVLVGSYEIPAEFPRMVTEALAGSGMDWPAIEAVRAYLSLHGIAAGPSVELEPWMLGGHAGSEEGPVIQLLTAGPGPVAAGIRDRFLRDPVANTAAVAVLLAMAVVLLLAANAVARGRRLPEGPDWAIPVLAAAGVAVASYLAFVEVTGTEAVCGPVGDCNTVQQSPYASIFGVPVGVIGIAGYLALAALWLAARLGPPPARRPATLALWAGAFGAVLFSAYLTFLEPFVIGATCLWCLTSAVLTTLILVAATPAAARLRPDQTRRPPARRAGRPPRARRAPAASGTR